ncbi:MAG TPA: triose-phosphate isomerase [Roseiarcus sp.]|nr:triose-phosphate isomerase [Roseiarcus sp.]
MTPGVRPLVAGNWKMNGLKSALGEIAAIKQAVEAGDAGEAEVIVCPPATLISQAAVALAGGPVRLGGQDCHPKPSGAYTGDISAAMLKDAGASYVIVGHSERRTQHEESSALVRAKAEAAIGAGLTAIICVGETREEREAGRANRIVAAQIELSLPGNSSFETCVIAYEPVWAIGTGLTPTPDDVADMHAMIRRLLIELRGAPGGKMRILYGGSVKPANAAELLGLKNVDGALVGGASLKAADFMGIAEFYRDRQ